MFSNNSSIKQLKQDKAYLVKKRYSMQTSNLFIVENANFTFFINARYFSDQQYHDKAKKLQ